MFNYDYGHEERDFFPYHSLTKTWLITWPGTLSQLGGWVSMSWVSGDGDVVTMSEGQWKRIPHSEEAALSWLPEEMTFMLCHVHMYTQACIFPRNFWTWGVNFNRIRRGQGTDPTDKLQRSLEDRRLQKRDLIVSSVRKGGSESPLLIEQWRTDTVRELKKNSTKEKNAVGDLSS